MLFATQGNGAPSTLTGWRVLGSSGAANYNYLMAVRVCQAGDPGSVVSVTFTGSFAGEMIVVSVSGVHRVFGYASTQDGGGSVSSITTRATNVDFAGEDDLALYFGAGRQSSGTLNLSRGTIIERRDADTDVCSVLGSETLANLQVDPLRVTITPASGTLTGMVAGCVILSGT